MEDGATPSLELPVSVVESDDASHLPTGTCQRVPGFDSASWNDEYR